MDQIQDIPYFVPFRNALQCITEVTTPLFCTSLRTELIQILINLLTFLQVLLQQVYFSSRFCFMKIGQVTPRILSKLGVHYGSDKVLPPFKNPHFYYLKLFVSEAFHYFQIKVMAQKNSDYFESYGIIFMPDRQ